MSQNTYLKHSIRLPNSIFIIFITLLLFQILFQHTQSWVIVQNEPTQFSIRTASTSEDNAVRSMFITPGSRVVSFFGDVISQQSRCTLGDGAQYPSQWYWELNISTAYSSYDLIPTTRWIWNQTTQKYEKEIFNGENYLGAQQIPYIRYVAPTYDPKSTSLPILRLNCTNTNSILFDTGLTSSWFGFTSQYLLANEHIYPTIQNDRCNPYNTDNIFCRKHYPSDLVLASFYSYPASQGIAYLAQGKTHYQIRSITYPYTDPNGITTEVEFRYQDQIMFGTTIYLTGQRFNGLIPNPESEQYSTVNYKLLFYDARTQRKLYTLQPINIKYQFGSPQCSFSLPRIIPMVLEEYISTQKPIRIQLEYLTQITTHWNRWNPLGYYSLFDSVYLTPFSNTPFPFDAPVAILNTKIHGLYVPTNLAFIRPSLVDSDHTMVFSTAIGDLFAPDAIIKYPSIDISHILYSVSTYLHIEAYTGVETTITASLFIRHFRDQTDELDSLELPCEVLTVQVGSHFWIPLLCRLTNPKIINSVQQISYHKLYQFRVSINYIDIEGEDVTVTGVLPKTFGSYISCDRSKFQYFAPFGFKAIFSNTDTTLVPNLVCYQCPETHLNKVTQTECILDKEKFIYGVNSHTYAVGKFQCPEQNHLPHKHDDHDHNIVKYNTNIYQYQQQRQQQQQQQSASTLTTTLLPQSNFYPTQNHNEGCHSRYSSEDGLNHCRCMNGGTCQYVLANDPTQNATVADLAKPLTIHPFLMQCICPEGYMGRYCQLKKTCKNIPVCAANRDHYFNTFIDIAPTKKIEKCSKPQQVECHCSTVIGHKNEQHGDDEYGHNHDDYDHYDPETTRDEINTLPTPYLDSSSIVDPGINLSPIQPWTESDEMTENCACQKKVLNYCHPTNTHEISFSYHRCPHNSYFKDPHLFAQQPTFCVCKFGFGGPTCSNPVIFFNIQLTNNQMAPAGAYKYDDDHFYLKESVRRTFLIHVTAKMRIILNNNNTVVELYEYNTNTRNATLIVYTPTDEELKLHNITLPYSTVLPNLFNTNQLMVSNLQQEQQQQLQVNSKLIITTSQIDRDRLYQIYLKDLSQSLISAGDWTIAARFADYIVYDPLCDSKTTTLTCPIGPIPTNRDIRYDLELQTATKLLNINEKVHNWQPSKTNWKKIGIIIGIVIGCIIVLLLILFLLYKFHLRVMKFLPQVLKERARRRHFPTNGQNIASDIYNQDDEVLYTSGFFDDNNPLSNYSHITSTNELSIMGSKLATITNQNNNHLVNGVNINDLRRGSNQPNNQSQFNSNSSTTLPSTLVPQQLESERPLPSGWTFNRDQYGKEYYVNLETMRSQLHHPDDEFSNGWKTIPDTSNNDNNSDGSNNNDNNSISSDISSPTTIDNNISSTAYTSMNDDNTDDINNNDSDQDNDVDNLKSNKSKQSKFSRKNKNKGQRLLQGGTSDE